METSFCELKGKEVINIVDGKKLGRIIDIVFDTRFGKMLGIVVPAYNKSWNIFKSSDDIFIPFNCICKFGDDAILVQILVPNNQTNKKGIFLNSSKTQVQNAGQNSVQTKNIDENNMQYTDIQSTQYGVMSNEHLADTQNTYSEQNFNTQNNKV